MSIQENFSTKLKNQMNAKFTPVNGRTILNTEREDVSSKTKKFSSEIGKSGKEMELEFQFLTTILLWLDMREIFPMTQGNTLVTEQTVQN